MFFVVVVIVVFNRAFRRAFQLSFLLCALLSLYIYVLYIYIYICERKGKSKAFQWCSACVELVACVSRRCLRAIAFEAFSYLLNHQLHHLHLHRGSQVVSRIWTSLLFALLFVSHVTPSLSFHPFTLIYIYIYVLSHCCKTLILICLLLFFVLSVTFLFTQVENLLTLLFYFCCYCYYVPYFD